jgi:hypothetical protein
VDCVAFGAHSFKVREVKKFTSAFGREKSEIQNGGAILMTATLVRPSHDPGSIESIRLSEILDVAKP